MTFSERPRRPFSDRALNRLLLLDRLYTPGELIRTALLRREQVRDGLAPRLGGHSGVGQEGAQLRSVLRTRLEHIVEVLQVRLELREVLLTARKGRDKRSRGVLACVC